MKIFVAFGYNERDKWIPELVIPLIEAFGDEVLTGEELQGEGIITNAVRQKIKCSDALIGFTTRRGEAYAENRWRTHRWVTDEIALALESKGAGSRVVEVRELGVDEQGGIAGDRQKIDYNEKERDKSLIKLATTIGRWRREHGNFLKLQLLPSEFVEQITPFLDNEELTCTCSILRHDDMFSDPEQFATSIKPIDQGLYIHTRGVPDNALIQIRVKYRDQRWSSSFLSTDSLSVNLRQG